MRETAEFVYNQMLTAIRGYKPTLKNEEYTSNGKQNNNMLNSLILRSPTITTFRHDRQSSC